MGAFAYLPLAACGVSVGLETWMFGGSGTERGGYCSWENMMMDWKCVIARKGKGGGVHGKDNWM